jgi:hypothetical protein
MTQSPETQDKSVTVTDEMVDAALRAHWEDYDWGRLVINDLQQMVPAMRDAIAAALTAAQGQGR